MASYKRQDIVEFDDDSIIKRLMSKVTTQAKELSDTYRQLEESNTYITKLERRLEAKKEQIFASSSLNSQISIHSNRDIALLRKSDREAKEHIVLLEKQIKALENRLQDSLASKKALCKSLDTKTKENKSLERKIKELRGEQNGSSNPANSSKNMKEMERYIIQLERDFKTSLALIAQLEARNHHDEGSSSAARPEDSQEVSDEKDNQIEAMQRQIVLLQQKLLLTQDLLTQAQPHALPHPSNQAIVIDEKRYQDLERERDILLEYIHDDMEKSGKILDKLNEVEKELSKANEERSDTAKKLTITQDALDEETQRSKKLADELASIHDKFCHNSMKVEELQVAYDKFRNENESKTIECEELSNLQMNLMLQVCNLCQL
jgi:chromosome segregation ATPase